MQTSNRTVDALLTKPPSSANQADSGASTVSNYNNRDNSFDHVLEQQRNRHSRAQRPDGPAEQDRSPSKCGASQEQCRSAIHESSRGGSEIAADGNALPVQEEHATASPEAESIVGDLLAEPDTGASPADVAAKQLDAGAVVTASPQQQDETTDVGQPEHTAGAELSAVQTPGSGPLVVNNELDKAQRGATAPAGIVNQQRDAGSAVSMLNRSSAEQITSGSTDPALLQETQSFKDALQRLRAAEVVPAATPLRASSEAAGTVEQASQSLLRVDQLLNAPQAAPGVKPEVALSTIQVPVSSANWGQAVAQRVLWLASNGVQAAELQLHPRELGPVEIRISVANDQTQVQFSSQYGVVRESLEASMQRLRELFEASGLHLADVNVSDQSLAEQRQSADQEATGKAGHSGAVEEAASPVSVATEQISGAGLVDFYA